MNLRPLYAITLFSAGLGLTARMVQKSISIDYIEEKVHNSTFSYRRDMVDGELKETWMIDGKKVKQGKYDDMILQAEMDERRKERSQEYKARLRRLEFQESASRACYEKLLASVIDQLKELIDKFKKYNLLPHIVYSQETIDSKEELERLEGEIIPLLQKRLQDTKNFEVLQETYQAVSTYPDHLRECLYQTIQYAIKIMDDTKQLKELLTLISQEC